jgi:hypothetical protein
MSAPDRSKISGEDENVRIALGIVHLPRPEIGVKL